MATLKDIADKVNVSPSAVSRVLNNDPTFSISSSTRQLILQTAQELQYSGVQRKKHRSSNLLLLTLYSEFDEMNDSYYLTIRLNIKKEAEWNGFTVNEIFGADNMEPKVLNEKLKNNDGVIVIGSTYRFTEKLALALKKSALPVVLADFWSDERSWDTIYVDFSEAVGLAMDHLSEIGRKRIGFIGALEMNNRTGEFEPDLREKYYVKYRNMAGKYDRKDVFVGRSVSCDEGYRLMREAIAGGNMPDAFFVATDDMAIGAMKALSEAGIAIPSEVALVGCNDTPAAAYLTPSLSTVRIRADLIGKFAFLTAKNRIENDRDTGIRIMVPCEMMVRHSSVTGTINDGTDDSLEDTMNKIY